uniref:Reverse transcriptase domain-containing protein n=1 Tax=Fagus sylvatica TaxID=28930 RepID=A0A2N9GX79_FAGSY
MLGVNGHQNRFIRVNQSSHKMTWSKYVENEMSSAAPLPHPYPPQPPPPPSLLTHPYPLPGPPPASIPNFYGNPALLSPQYPYLHHHGPSFGWFAPPTPAMPTTSQQLPTPPHPHSQPTLRSQPPFHPTHEPITQPKHTPTMPKIAQPPKFQTHPPPYTRIENKMFSISVGAGGGNQFPLSITRNKFGKVMGKIWLGHSDMDWLRVCVDTVVSSGDGEFFRQCRTGYKSIHVTRRANANGKFLEVSEYHSGSRQGALRIPAGETKSGWVDFGQLCKTFWDPNHQTTAATNGGNQRRVVNVDMGTRMAREGNLPKISHANQNPTQHVAAAMNSALSAIQTNLTGVNSFINLEIKLELGIKLDGFGRPASSRSMKVWKPKLDPMGQPVLIKPNVYNSGHTQAEGSSSTGRDPCVVDRTGPTPPNSSAETNETDGGDLSHLSLAVEPRVEILAPLSGEGVEWLWGSSSAWMLELRDGRRVSIPLSLLRSPASLDCRGGSSGGRAISSRRGWGEEGSLLCWGNENSPLEVAPLAMAGPCSDAATVKIDREVCTHSLSQDTGMAFTPSDWVSETLIAFGIVMGASFEGHEEQIMSILQDIENRRNQQGVEKVKGAKTGGKGSRELRNLISNINYDGGSARKRGTTRDKGTWFMLGNARRRRGKTKPGETEKAKDITKVNRVNADTAVEGMVESNPGETVTAQSKDVTWADKGNTKAVKQWVPRAKHGEQKVGPDAVVGTSFYWATQENTRSGDGPWSTYEVGESSGPTKQHNEREVGFLNGDGPKVVHNGPNKEPLVSLPNVVDIGPNRETFVSLPNLTSQESRTSLTGRGHYQLSVDWDLVEAFIPTNRGMVSEVPVRIAVDFLPQRSFRLLDREKNSSPMDRYEEGAQCDTEQELLDLADNTCMILASSMEDKEVLDVSPLRTNYGEITQGFESEAMRLFEAIERRWRQNGGTGADEKEPTQKSRKGLRELHNLECLVNYESSQKVGGGRRFRGAVESEGAFGGTLIMWDRRVVEVQNCVKGQYTISCRFKNIQDQREWAYSGVYGPNVDANRGILWEELTGVHSWWGVPWCIGGNFKVVRFPSEKLRAGRHTRAMQDFSDFIFELGLVDFPLLEGQFTWSNNQDPPSKSRIDRFLVSTDWEEQFSKLTQKALPRCISDHCPIMLECGNFNGGKSYFKFENMWLQHQDFVGNVRNWWGGYDFSGKSQLHSGECLMGKKIRALLTAEEKAYRVSTQTELEQTLLLDEVAWRQKSRVKRLKEGDKNTKFFQRTANAHRRNNQIESMKHGDQHWKEAWRPVLGGVEFNSIDSAEALQLEGPFSEEEVVTALNQMSGEKASGPDGYTIAFYKHCWDIVKIEVLNSLQEFHDHESIKRSLNATFVVLIPKKAGASDVKDFRPICLIGSVYKILANRLKLVLGAILSPTQNAFIQGREITESVLIANECLDSRIKSGIPGLLCKLDVEKATRGIRQGDSLSPLLFVLVMEALTRLMDKAVYEQLLEGFAVNTHNRLDLKISHLLFADDTLIMCGADRDQLLHLKGVLMCFEAVIGGRITTLPMKYLGLPLGARYKSKEIWNPILEKMERRLAEWKRLYLSKGGRLTLIKSTLSSLPTYFLSLFPIPSSVAKRIKKIQRDFLWGGIGEEFKYHLVNWRTVCTPIPMGGLGIRQTIPFNQALMGKWLWRFATENNAFWRQVIASKYGVEKGDWYTKEEREGHGVCLWKHIRLGWQQFSKYVSYSIGSGEREGSGIKQPAINPSHKEKHNEVQLLVINLQSYYQGMLYIIGSRGNQTLSQGPLYFSTRRSLCGLGVKANWREYSKFQGSKGSKHSHKGLVKLGNQSSMARSVVNQSEWVFSSVYGPQTDKERFPPEKLRGHSFTQAMQGFSDFISSCGLVDPPLEGGQFTWSNSREEEAMSRIDRFLYTAAWEDQFPSITQRRLPRVLSDHFPLVLECGQLHQGKRPFRFENMWFKAEGFRDHVRQWWGSYQFHGSPSHVLANKLKTLKADLKKWNVESFGNVIVKQNQLWHELAELDRVAEERSLSGDERRHKTLVVEELEKMALLEEISWWQKSRAIWLKEGDKNTKFFHRLANSHHRYNSISSLLINGEMSTDQNSIADNITHFYTNLYSGEVGWRPKLDGIEFSMIPHDEALWLERPFDEEEVGGVLKAFNGDKAPPGWFSHGIFSIALLGYNSA